MDSQAASTSTSSLPSLAHASTSAPALESPSSPSTSTFSSASSSHSSSSSSSTSPAEMSTASTTSFLRARSTYRYLPQRPALGWRRSLTSRKQQAPPLGSGPDGQPDLDDPLLGKKKRRGVRSRLRAAWKSKPSSKWLPLPVGLGALVYGVSEYGKNWDGSRRRDRAEVGMTDEGDEMVVRVRGPWQVHVMGALPLRSLSRLWGYLNSFELPVWSRDPGFRLYSYVFGCNLDELAQPDLRSYVSLGDFFYRELKDGVRPIADAPLVSPADGKLLHFGAISGSKVEQVKGMSYSLDALLGKTGGPGSPIAEDIDFDLTSEVDDEDFANINDIEYSLGDLLGSSQKKIRRTLHPGEDSNSDSSSIHSAASGDSERSFSSFSSASPTGAGNSPSEDASVPAHSVPDTVVRDAAVALEMGANAMTGQQGVPKSSVAKLREGNGLFFTVIYLAPGDYHRFHSPAAWVVERRRHFAGELFSVSPFIARRLANLFVLNERVALLGRWRHGFFGMVPVGATNVGSIRINFDADLRTNKRLRHPVGTYMEAVYSKASSLLKGQPLRAGEEMGGFRLGSTIVLIFEAPKDFQFSVKEGEKIKVGEPIGYVPREK